MPQELQPNTSPSATPRVRAQSSFATASTDSSTDLRWLWLAVLRHRLTMALTVCCAVIPTVIYITLADPVYRATATIQIEPESAKVLPYVDVTDSLSNPLPHFELYMKTQDEVVRSGELRARVASHLRTLEAPKLDTVLPDLGKGLEVQRVEGSQLLRISYLAPDPELAATVANTWAEEFVKLHVEKKLRTAERATAFLQSQLLNLKQRVEQAEADLIRYARTHDFQSVDSKQDNASRQRFTYLNAETARAEKDMIARQAEYESLRRVSVEDFPENLKGPVVSSLETKAFQLEQELARLEAQFDQKWPAVVQKRNELAAVQGQLGAAKAATLARALKESETRYSAALTEYRMLQKALQQQQLLVNRLNEASIEYNTLKRELDVNEELYQGLLKRLKEAGVSPGSELSNITIADRATSPSSTYRPRKALSLSLAGILGIMLGLGLSVLLEYSSNTLTEPWDVESLGASLLGWVPKDTRRTHSQLALEGGATDTTKTLVPLDVRSTGGVPTHLEHQTTEAYRSLCASILLSRGDRPPKTILITSAIPKEGKTTVTIALAEAFAEISPPILLIDADFRNPSLTKRFGNGTPEGLSTYLAGGPLRITETSTPNLFLLTAGSNPPNPMSLLGATRMKDLLTELVENGRFRFVIIDGPPLLSVADPSVLAPKVEGVVIVVRAASTPKEVFKKAVVQLERTGCTILGAVVNALDLRKPGYFYYQKYYYGSVHAPDL